jgi:phage tail-like protein
MTIFSSVGTRVDPVLSHNFTIGLVDSSSALAISDPPGYSAVLDVPVAGFSECSGLEMSMQAEEYKEGGRNGAVLKFLNRVTWTPLTLKRGVTSGTQLWDWFYGFVAGNGRRRDGVITLLDGAHAPQRVWFFRRGLPTKYTGPALNATQNNVAIEAIEITHEGLFQMHGRSVITMGLDALAGLVS